MKILVGIDDSKFSEEALRAIVAQIRPQDAEVRVVHVLQPITLLQVPQMSAKYAPELEAQAKQAQELVERAGKTLRSAGFRASGLVEQGDIRLKIIDAAAEWEADLIVVGSHGRTAIHRMLLGSVSEYVARNARCSVEIVRIPANA